MDELNGRDVLAEVIRTVAAMVRLDPAVISAGTRFFQDLDFDSTNVLELLMHIEDDLGVEFDPDTFGTTGFETVGGLADHVRQIGPA